MENKKRTEIYANNSMNEITSCYGIKNYLFYNCTVPYELDLQSSVNEIEFNLDFYGNIDNSVSRKVIIEHSKKLVENQKMKPKAAKQSSYNMQKDLYSYEISYLNIYCEVYQKEIKKIKKWFDETQNEEKLSAILQNILLTFSQSYNESLAGEDFIRPIVTEYGAFRCSLYLKENDKTKLFHLVITPSYQLKKINKQKKLNIEAIQKKHLPWRYYFNKAKNSYDVYDNLDVILSSAISLESYVLYLIKINGKENDFNSYKTILAQQNQPAGFFSETKFLKNEKIISKKEMQKLNSCYSVFKDNRNKIVHGDIDNTIISRKSADCCIKKLINLYNEFERNSINYRSKKCNNFLVCNENRKKASEYIKNENCEKAINLLKYNIRKKMFMEESYYNLGLCYRILKNYKEAKKIFLECIRNEFALDLVYSQLGHVYYELKDFPTSIKYYKKSIKSDKYIKDYYNISVVYYNNNNFKMALKYLKLLLEKEPNDYEGNLAMANIYNKLKKFDEALKYIEVVISMKPTYENYFFKACILYQKNTKESIQDCIKILEKIRKECNLADEMLKKIYSNEIFEDSI